MKKFICKTRKFFSKTKLQTKMAWLFSLVVLGAIISVMALAYRYSYLALKEEAQMYTNQLLDQCEYKIDEYIVSMQQLSNIIVHNKDVNAYLEADDAKSALNQDLRGSLFGFLYSSTLSRSDINNIAILGDDRYILNRGQLQIRDLKDIEKEDWYQKALKASGKVVLSSSHKQSLVLDDEQQVITLSRSVKSKKTGRSLGVVSVDLNYDRIEKACSSIHLGKTGYFFLMNPNGDIVYHPSDSSQDQSAIKAIQKGGSGYYIRNRKNNPKQFYTVKQSDVSNWYLISVMYEDELVPDAVSMSKYFFGISILFVVIAIIVSRALSKYFSNPILKLQKSMIRVGEGEFDSKVNIEREDELGELAQGYNQMIDQIRDLMNQIVIEHNLKRKIEIESLQNQINPHFLYNTLDSIIWMAELDENEKVVEMTSSLSKLLRFSISKGAELISIEQEFASLESYLTIQKMRYDDLLTYSIYLDSLIKDYYTIKLLLQPIVENAIYHGIKNKEDGGHITISGLQENDHIVFTIEDTGVGMSSEILEKFHTFEKIEKTNKHIGVSNTYERIQLFFGSNYGIFYHSVLGEGTIVTITIPILEQNDIT